MLLSQSCLVLTKEWPVTLLVSLKIIAVSQVYLLYLTCEHQHIPHKLGKVYLYRDCSEFVTCAEISLFDEKDIFLG